MLMEKYHLSRPAASRQFKRYILPEMERGMMIGGEGEGGWGDGVHGGPDRRPGGGGSVDPPPDATPRRRQWNHQQQEPQQQQQHHRQKRQHQHGPDDVPRRSIVICDVTSSVGRALLGRYAIDGHDVAGCGRDPTEVYSLRRLFPNARLDVVDVSDDCAVCKWASSLEEGGTKEEEDGGRMMTSLLNDVVVIIIATDTWGNSAGTMPSMDRRRLRAVPAWEVPCEVFDATIEVGVRGASNVVRHFVPRMMRHRVMLDDATASAGRGHGGGGGTIVAVCSVMPDQHRAAQCAAACAIQGLIRSVALSIPGPHCAATLSPGGMAFADLGRKASKYLGGEEEDEEEQGQGGDCKVSDVDFERWASVAGPMILRMNRRNNGSTMSVPGF
jgi:NAD(P)-dependent dehydrogenase (short-subunit alcohol dehydrogenase family)